MLDTLEVIYRAANFEQANLLKNLLTDEGIEAHITNGPLQAISGKVPYGAIQPRLLVDPRDAARARKLALDFESVIARSASIEPMADRSASGSFSKSVVRILIYAIVWGILYGIVSDITRDSDLNVPAKVLVLGMFAATSIYLVDRKRRSAEGAPADHEPLDSEDAEEPPSTWPSCPSCSRRRHTTCPVCQTAGSDFSPAFMPESRAAEGGEPPLVICPTCDEPFTPLYLARCEWCGYRFADGRELPPPQLFTSPFAEMNSRVWIVLAAITMALGGLVGLFAWIARRA
jgi:hypothetical protein